MSEAVNPWPIIIVAGVLASFILAGLRAKARSSAAYGVAGSYTGRMGGGEQLSPVTG